MQYMPFALQKECIFAGQTLAIEKAYRKRQRREAISIISAQNAFNDITHNALFNKFRRGLPPRKAKGKNLLTKW